VPCLGSFTSIFTFTDLPPLPPPRLPIVRSPERSPVLMRPPEPLPFGAIWARAIVGVLRTVIITLALANRRS
jgi:hypothetical protein